MVSIPVNYVTYIFMEKKTENNEYEIECASNSVELGWFYISLEEMRV